MNGGRLKEGDGGGPRDTHMVLRKCMGNAHCSAAAQAAQPSRPT